MTNSEMVKDARRLAREAGLTLKADLCRINGAQGYKVICRDSGLLYRNWDGMTLSAAYETLIAM